MQAPLYSNANVVAPNPSVDEPPPACAVKRTSSSPGAHFDFVLPTLVGLLGLFLISLIGAREAAAQRTTGINQPDSVAAPIVKEVRFSGNEFFTDDELALRIRTGSNRRFLGIPGATWWLWLYRLGESGALGSRVGQALMAGGEPPAHLDGNVLAADLERLRIFYRQEGFRESEIDVEVDTLSADDVAVIFRIQPGSPTFIRQVRYEGLESLAPAQQIQFARGTLLSAVRMDFERPLTFRTRNQRYSEPTLLEERRRMLTYLRDHGYAAVTRDSIRALVFSHSPDSFDVTFRVRTGSRYRFGDVHFVVDGPESGATSRGDTLMLRPPADTVAGGSATVSIDNETRLSPGLLMRTLQFRPGEWYSLASVLATKRRLEGTGVFLFTDISALPRDTTRVQPGLPPRLPHRIDLRTRRRHQIRLETFMLQRSENVFASASELGTGVGVTYENVNLLGRGETFRVQTTGSIAADNDLRSLTAAQAEITTSLTYPYLVGPLRRLESTFGLYDARTRFSLSLLTARHDDLRLIIRARGNARYRLELRHSETNVSLVDLIDVSLSNPDTLNNFGDVILDRFLEPIADPVQQAQIIEDYTRPQINTALRYTFRSSTANPLRRERGYSYEAGVEIGNTVPYLLDRLVYSPGTIEGSLPGVPLFSEEGTPGRLVYRQYVRLVGDSRRYVPIGIGSVFAFKAVGGFAHPIGSANIIPFDRRFFAGGASSVRGWGLRELGPGGARFASTDETDTTRASADFTNILGGDVKLEAGVELRNTILRSLLAADWIGVAFVDAGNVWFGPRNPGFGEEVSPSDDGKLYFRSFYRQIGVGSGIGLRIAWDYLIVRLDLGVKLFDPRRSEEGLLPDGLRDIQPHFGIGHAF